jgi:hypothetical protein
MKNTPIYDVYPDESSHSVVNLHLEPDVYDLIESSIGCSGYGCTLHPDLENREFRFNINPSIIAVLSFRPSVDDFNYITGWFANVCLYRNGGLFDFSQSKNHLDGRWTFNGGDASYDIFINRG